MKIVIAGAGAVGLPPCARSSACRGPPASRSSTSIPRPSSRSCATVSTCSRSCAGSTTSRDALRVAAGTPDADLFIGVSDQDEINMLACAAASTRWACAAPWPGCAAPTTRQRQSRSWTRCKLGITQASSTRTRSRSTPSWRWWTRQGPSTWATSPAARSCCARSTSRRSPSSAADRCHRLKEDYAGTQFLVAAVQREGQHFIPKGGMTTS